MMKPRIDVKKGKVQMNQTEKRYAMSRVDQIKNSHIAELESNKIQIKPLALNEKLGMICNGEAEFQPDKAIPVGSYGLGSPLLVDVYIYPEADRVEATRVAAAARYNRTVDSIRDAAKAIQDEIMLGDSDKAFVALQKFQAQKF